MARDYYVVLGISKDASIDDIKKAYKKLAIRWHPDKNENSPEATEKFKEIAEAYDCLADSSKRSAYDRYGHDGMRTQGTGNTGPFRGQNIDPNDIFAAFFGGMDSEELFGMGGTFGGLGGPGIHFSFGGPTGFGMGPRRRRGGGGGPGAAGPQIQEVPVTLEEVARGCTKTYSVEGNRVNLQIPKGAESGFKLSAEGATFRVRVSDHPVFTRDGADLFHTAVIGILEFLLLGKRTYKLSTPAGEILEVDLPCLGILAPVALKGKGLPKQGSNDRGDLYVSSFIFSTRALVEFKEVAKKIILMMVFLLVMINPQLIFLFFFIKPFLT